MEPKLKIVLGCLAALVVGAAAMSPLFLSGQQEAMASSTRPQFDVSVAYAYLAASTATVPVNSSDPISLKFGPWEAVPCVEYYLGFNITRLADESTAKSQAVFEYFLVQISSDHGVIGNFTYYAVAFTDWAKSKFYFSREGWFDSNVTSGSGTLNWTAGTTIQLGVSGQAIDWYPAFGSPSSAAVTVSRLGVVVLDTNSTLAYPESPSVVARAQLANNGTGLLYNELPLPPAKP